MLGEAPKAIVVAIIALTAAKALALSALAETAIVVATTIATAATIDMWTSTGLGPKAQAPVFFQQHD